MSYFLKACSIFVLVVSKGCRPAVGITLGSGKSQPLRALYLSLSRYRLNQLSLPCGNACFHLNQLKWTGLLELKLVPGKGLLLRDQWSKCTRTGPPVPPLPLCQGLSVLPPVLPLGLGHASPVRWLGPLATRCPIGLGFRFRRRFSSCRCRSARRRRRRLHACVAHLPVFRCFLVVVMISSVGLDGRTRAGAAGADSEASAASSVSASGSRRMQYARRDKRSISGKGVSW